VLLFILYSYQPDLPSSVLLFAVYFFMSLNTNAYISLGSNLGDRAANLLMAIRGILEAGLVVTRISQIYETEPVETFAQPPFLNMAAELDGALPTPDELMERLLRIEQSLGRIRDQAKGPRTIDLDLLLYGDEISDSDFLKLPHPRLQRRRFVLVPLAEIAPRLVHPTLNKSVTELLENLDVDSDVKLWKP
jgi:2-amino-4-hydroxy-6-hydroxymethyldihydropteridine diphosphokinase